MSERLPNYKYKMIDHSYENLKALNFKKIYGEPDFYSYKFVVDQYKDTPTLFCTLILNSEDGNVRMDVTDANGNIYPEFYQDSYGSNEYIEKVNHKIKFKLTKLGIKRQKEKKHGRKNDSNK